MATLSVCRGYRHDDVDQAAYRREICFACFIADLRDESRLRILMHRRKPVVYGDAAEHGFGAARCGRRIDADQLVLQLEQQRPV